MKEKVNQGREVSRSEHTSGLKKNSGLQMAQIVNVGNKKLKSRPLPTQQKKTGGRQRPRAKKTGGHHRT